MARKLIQTSLPEWAWLDGSDHEEGGNPLKGRMVMLHVRSAAVIEVFNAEDFVPNANVVTHEFSFTNVLGAKESHIAALHYCAATSDREVWLEILRLAAKWFEASIQYEDRKIINDDRAELN